MNKGDYTIYITSIVKGIQFMNKSKQEEHAYLPKSVYGSWISVTVVNIKRNIFLMRWRILGMNHSTHVYSMKLKFVTKKRKNKKKRKKEMKNSIILLRITVYKNSVETLPHVCVDIILFHPFEIVKRPWFFYDSFFTQAISIDWRKTSDEAIFLYLVTDTWCKTASILLRIKKQ